MILSYSNKIKIGNHWCTYLLVTKSENILKISQRNIHCRREREKFNTDLHQTTLWGRMGDKPKPMENGIFKTPARKLSITFHFRTLSGKYNIVKQ